VERAHRLALAIPEPGDARARFALGHLHQKLATAMERLRGPSPLRRLHLPPDAIEDRCDPRRAAWWRAVAEHRRRFARLVPPSRAHGRGNVASEIARDLACAGDLRAALRELGSWRSDWAGWQRGWYAFLAGDLARASLELRDPSLDRTIPAAALLPTRVILAALSGDEPRRRALCAGPAPERPLEACRAAPLAFARLEGKLILPPGATAELLLFPLGLKNGVIARDPLQVYRNLSFVHHRARVGRDGRFRIPRILPGSYHPVLKIFSELPRLEGAPPAELHLGPGERRRLPPLRVQPPPIRSEESTGSRSR
jgi:hypothetical protein